MKIQLCKKCKQHPKFSYEDVCIDCLPEDQLEVHMAEQRVNEALELQNEIGWQNRGGKPEIEGGE